MKQLDEYSSVIYLGRDIEEALESIKTLLSRKKIPARKSMDWLPQDDFQNPAKLLEFVEQCHDEANRIGLNHRRCLYDLTVRARSFIRESMSRR
jgi:hypothetical protein